MTLPLSGTAPANIKPIAGAVATAMPASSTVAVMPLSEWLQVMTEEVQRKVAVHSAERETPFREAG